MLRGTPGPLKRQVTLLILLTLRPVTSNPGAFDLAKTVVPAAENSLDDKSRLPAQVCGIIGAYLACVVLIGVLLLTYGRKMRRAVHDRIDVVKANQANGFEMSPLSPGSTSRSRWWPQSPNRLKQALQRNPEATNPESVPTSPLSVTESMASFDQHFLRSQQEQRQREMEILYAAVMKHDEEKRKQKLRESAEELADGGSIRKEPRDAGRSLGKLNTNSLHPRGSQQQQPPSPTSPLPRTPVRAVYPSGSHRRFSGAPPTVQEGQGLHPPQEEPPSLSPRGFFSRSRTPSHGSTESKPRRSIRNLRISNPIPRFSASDNDEEARSPLSPRHFKPGVPPGPPSATTADTPTTTGSLGPFRYDDMERPPTYYRPEVSRQYPRRSSASSPIKDSHRISRHSSNNSPPPHFPLQPPSSPTSTTVPVLLDHPHRHKQQTPPPALRLATATLSSQGLPQPQPQPQPHHSATSSTSTLPFRVLHPEPESTSPVATKTTVLETRRHGRGLLSPTSRLRTPGTAGGRVPMTPYSPYMPFTPVTPVTPHLVTRKERKLREKEERKARGRAGIVDESEEVGYVDWGEAY